MNAKRGLIVDHEQFNDRKRVNEKALLFIIAALFLVSSACTKKALYKTTRWGVPIVRVLVADEQPYVAIYSETIVSVRSSRKHFKLKAFDTLTIAQTDNYQFPLEFENKRGVPIFVSGIGYPGKVNVLLNSQLKVINVIDMETYVKGVVPHEIGTRPIDELEVVKAQAIAARTYAIKHLNLDRNPTYDLVASVYDQVYKGFQYRNALSDSAVTATYGEIIAYNGEPIEAKYSSTCGGITSDVTDNWGNDRVPYLRSIKDEPSPAFGAQEPFCSISRLYTWEEKFSREDFYRMIRGNLYGTDSTGHIAERPSITGFNLKRNPRSKRVTTLEIKTETDEFVFKGLDIRKVLKEEDRLLWSNYFFIKSTQDSIFIQGKGAGHGCGMCQWGAIGMAQKGYQYKEILKHYYRGTNVKKLY